MGDRPTDLKRLARCYGLTVVETSGRAKGLRAGEFIGFDETISLERQRFTLAHELAHFALEEHGYTNERDEWAADFVGAAILLPERPFKRALHRFRWDLGQITAYFGCSWEVAARRIADTKSAIVTIIDNGKTTARVQGPWIQRPYAAEPMRLFEVEMALEAKRAGAHIYVDDLCRAWWVPGDDGWERTILVIGIEEFERLAKREWQRESGDPSTEAALLSADHQDPRKSPE